MRYFVISLCLLGFTKVWAFHPQDDCSDALVLTIPTNSTANTTGAATDVLTPCGNAVPQNGIWYSVIGDGTLLRFSTCFNSNNSDDAVQIFRGTCGSLVCVGGTDDTWCSSNSNGVTATWCSEFGVQYFIHFGGVSGVVVSEFLLSSVGACNYTGGNCEPQAVVAPASVNGTTFQRDDCCDGDGADHHYAVTLPYTSNWKFRVCEGQASNIIKVGTTFCGSSLCVANDNVDLNNVCYPQGSCGCLTLSAGIYHVTIEWAGDDGAGGPHKLQIVDCNAFNNYVELGASAGQISIACGYVLPNEPLNIIVSADNPNPAEPPLLSITGGCDDLCTGGGNPATWHFDPGVWELHDGNPGVPGQEDPYWHNTIVGLTEGSVCLALEGFLGVELASFTAIPSDGEVILNWQTSSEQDLSSFKLYRGEALLTVLPASNSATGESYSYRDRNVMNGQTYSYTLYAEEMNGDLTRLAMASATPQANPEVIGGFALAQNFPNPFNPETTIEFSINEPGEVLLRVFDLNGREVTVLVNGALADGVHAISFDGAELPSGLYFYRLEYSGFSLSKKMVLLK